MTAIETGSHATKKDPPSYAMRLRQFFDAGSGANRRRSAGQLRQQRRHIHQRHRSV